MYNTQTNCNLTLWMKVLLLVFLLSTLSQPLISSPIIDQMRIEFQDVKRDDQILSLIRTWLPRLVDEEDFEYIQRWWSMVDPEGCETWFAEQHQKDVDNPWFHYLWLKTQFLSVDILLEAVDIITDHPDYYLAYKFIAEWLPQVIDLTNSNYGGFKVYEQLKEKGVIFEKTLQKGERIFGPDPYILSALSEYYAFKEQPSKLKKTLVKLAKSSSPKMVLSHLVEECKYKQNSRLARKILPIMVSTGIANGQFSQAEEHLTYNIYLVDMLYLAEEWKSLDKLLRDNPALEEHGKYYPTYRMTTLLNLGNVSEAIDYARNVIGSGYHWDILIDSFMADTPDDDAWYSFADEMETLSHNNEEQQLNEQLIIREMPELDIRDEEGKAFNFDEYKGKPLTLVFWSSWGYNDLSSFDLESLLRNPDTGQLVLVNGYDSDKKRAKARLTELVPGMPFYSIDDSGLESLEAERLPLTVKVTPEGKIVYQKNEGYYY